MKGVITCGGGIAYGAYGAINTRGEVFACEGAVLRGGVLTCERLQHVWTRQLRVQALLVVKAFCMLRRC